MSQFISSPLSEFPVLLLPLDCRPVCYQTPILLASLLQCSLYIPPESLFGNLKQPADTDALLEWCDETLAVFEARQQQPQVIASVQLMLHGGLIPARLEQRTEAETIDVLDDTWLRLFHSYNVTPDAMSAILRIPAYNNAEEEPDYWAVYGKAMYQQSERWHRTLEGAYPAWQGELYQQLATFPPPTTLPEGVWQDFLARRQRSHAVHRFLLEEQERGAVNRVVFAQDDTGTHGLNVAEAQELQALGARTTQAWVQTGADEVAHTLLLRSCVEHLQLQPKVWVGYSHTHGGAVLAKFDGVPIATVVQQRLQACGARVVATPQQADVWLLVHTPQATMGDHCSVQLSDGGTPEAHAWVLAQLAEAQTAGKGVILADVAYANGADAVLFEKLLNPDALKALWGYGAWNTPGNAVGSAVAMGLAVWVSQELGCYQPRVHQQLLAVRLLDDGAYQAIVRQQVRGLYGAWQVPSSSAIEQAVADRLKPWQRRISELLPLSLAEQWQATLPCQRLFEVGFRL